MDITPLMLIGAATIALFVGLLTGIFGVGGGFLISPALMMIGVSGPVAIGTGVAAILINSTFAIFKRRGTATIDAKLALTMSAGSIVGVAIGFTLLETLKTLPPLTILGKEHIAAQYILLCIFLLLLIFLAVFLKLESRGHDINPDASHIGLFAKIRLAPFAHFDSLDIPRLSIIPVITLGLIIGIATGLLGIGGGVLLLPALIYLIGQKTSKAAGTSLLLVSISSLIAVALNFKGGNISIKLWAVMVTSGLIGTNIGTHIGLNTKDNKLKKYFAYVVLTAVIIIAYKLYSITFGK
jgi:hypothetical protein